MENYFVDYIIKLRIYINTYDMIENLENVLNIFILKIFLYINPLYIYLLKLWKLDAQQSYIQSDGPQEMKI